MWSWYPVPAISLGGTVLPQGGNVRRGEYPRVHQGELSMEGNVLQLSLFCCEFTPSMLLSISWRCRRFFLTWFFFVGCSYRSFALKRSSLLLLLINYNKYYHYLNSEIESRDEWKSSSRCFNIIEQWHLCPIWIVWHRYLRQRDLLVPTQSSST